MAYEDRIMRMAGSVPQRTVRPDRPNIGYDRAGPARMEPATYNRPSRTLDTEVTPMALQGANVGFGSSPNIGRDRAGAGIFGGNQYSANDMVNAMYGGIYGEQLPGEADFAGGAFGSGSKSQRDNIQDINIYNMLVDKHGQLKADEIYGEYLRKKYKFSGTGAPSGEYIPGGTKLVT